jgi:hypothetical protein
MTIFCGAIEKFLPHPLAFARFAAMRARAHELAMSVQHVLDLPSKIGGNIIAGMIEPQFDHSSRVLSIPRRGGRINGNCGQCLERTEGVPPG